MVFERLSRSRPDLPEALDEALYLGLEKNPSSGRTRPGCGACWSRPPSRCLSRWSAPVFLSVWSMPFDQGERRGRLHFFAQHVLAAALTLGSVGYLLWRVPFYPRSWVVPLVIASSFLSLLAPSWGASGCSAAAGAARLRVQSRLGRGVLLVRRGDLRRACAGRGTSGLCCSRVSCRCWLHWACREGGACLGRASAWRFRPCAGSCGGAGDLSVVRSPGCRWRWPRVSWAGNVFHMPSTSAVPRYLLATRHVGSPVDVLGALAASLGGTS